MIAKPNAYPRMKDSGVIWMEQVPAHWQVLRGKSLFRSIDVRSETGNEELLTVSSERGVVPRSSATVTMFKAESYVGYKLCWPGDLVINSLWAWAGGLGTSRYHGIVSSAYGVYRLRLGYDDYSEYIHRLVRSTPFNFELRIRSKGIWISRLQLTDDAFLNAAFPLPPVKEQTAIVRFLDYADGHIRRYIRAKQKLIALLEEQKQAIIHQAVTGQFDVRNGNRYPAYKEAGLGWLRDVPAHWEEISLGAATHSIQTGPFGSQLHASDYVSGGIPVINPTHMHNGSIESDPSISISHEKAKELLRHQLQPCDIVMARRGEVGRCALVTGVEAGWICGTGSLRIRPKSGTFVPAYLLHVLSAPGVRGTLNLSSIGATMDNLNAGMVSRLRLPAPPLPEQMAIIKFVDKARNHIENTGDCSRRQIELLDAYRARLIADVVTGKVDVREVARALPEGDPFHTEDDLDDTLDPDAEAERPGFGTIAEGLEE